MNELHQNIPEIFTVLISITPENHHAENKRKRLVDMDLSIKIVVVGDGAVGKTCLLWVYAKNDFPTDYVPTVFDNYSANIMVDGRTITLELWDTAGQEEYDSLRPLSYPGTSIFLVCFSVDNPSSYENIKIKWFPEIKHHSPSSPLILVATKADLRSDVGFVNQLAKSNIHPVSQEQGEDLKKHIKAVKFVECSAKTNQGIKQVFDDAIRIALFATPKPKETSTSSRCLLL